MGGLRLVGCFMGYFRALRCLFAANHIGLIPIRAHHSPSIRCDFHPLPVSPKNLPQRSLFSPSTSLFAFSIAPLSRSLNGRARIPLILDKTLVSSRECDANVLDMICWLQFVPKAVLPKKQRKAEKRKGTSKWTTLDAIVSII